MDKHLQAKHIPDDVFIAAVQVCSMRTAVRWAHDTAWCNRMDVEELLTQFAGFEIPWKVVIAKAKAVIKKGRMEGCTCGCRGDFDLRGYPDDPFTTKQTPYRVLHAWRHRLGNDEGL